MTDSCGHGECRKLRELLSDYVDEDLRDAVRAELDRHLGQCPDCHVEVDSVRKVIRLYRQCGELPYEVRIRLQDVIRRARAGEIERDG